MSNYIYGFVDKGKEYYNLPCHSSACLRYQTTYDLIEELKQRDDIETIDIGAELKKFKDTVINFFRGLK